MRRYLAILLALLIALPAAYTPAPSFAGDRSERHEWRKKRHNGEGSYRRNSSYDADARRAERERQREEQRAERERRQEERRAERERRQEERERQREEDRAESERRQWERDRQRDEDRRLADRERRLERREDRLYSDSYRYKPPRYRKNSNDVFIGSAAGFALGLMFGDTQAKQRQLPTYQQPQLTNNCRLITVDGRRMRLCPE